MRGHVGLCASYTADHVHVQHCSTQWDGREDSDGHRNIAWQLLTLILPFRWKAHFRPYIVRRGGLASPRSGRVAVKESTGVVASPNKWLHSKAEGRL